MPRPAQPFRARGRTSRRSRAIVPTLIVLAVLAILYGVATALWTERLWFASVDFTSVFTRKLLTETGLFLVFALLMAASVAVNAVLAYRLRPRYRPVSVEQQSLDRYRDAIDPVRRWVVIGASILLGLMAGASAAGQWQTFLLWLNGEPFGEVDVQFSRDLGFYAFDYPWWRFVLSFGFAVVVIGLIAAAVTHYVYGGIRLQTPGQKVTPAAQVHLSVLIGLFILLKAVAYWMDRYGILIHDGDLITGATYTDVKALLPAKMILIFIALICAVLFFVNVWRRSWTLPGIGLGLLVICAVLLGGLWPFLVQQFQVRPNEPDRERPYIERNIAATREAYGVSDVDSEEYRATTEVEAGQLEEDSETIPGIRLLDPNVVPLAFQQLQQVRGFYAFSDPLDVDRYEVNGENRDVVVAVRDVDLPASRRGSRTGTTSTPSTPTGSGSWRRTAIPARPTALRPGPRRTSRRPASSAHTNRASTSARARPSTRSSVRPRAPRRSSSTSRRTRTRVDSSATTPTTARAVSRSGRS